MLLVMNISHETISLSLFLFHDSNDSCFSFEQTDHDQTDFFSYHSHSSYIPAFFIAPLTFLNGSHQLASPFLTSDSLRLLSNPDFCPHWDCHPGLPYF